jgi:hypothetical protein
MASKHARCGKESARLSTATRQGEAATPAALPASALQLYRRRLQLLSPPEAERKKRQR